MSINKWAIYCCKTFGIEYLKWLNETSILTILQNKNSKNGSRWKSKQAQRLYIDKL